MKTLPDKLIAIVESRLEDFPKVEGVIVGRTREGQTTNVLIAVQRVNSFVTMFKIKLTIEPLAATVTMSPLIVGIEPTDVITDAQKTADQIVLDFVDGDGSDVDKMIAALSKRLRMGGIED